MRVRLLASTFLVSLVLAAGPVSAKGVLVPEDTAPESDDSGWMSKLPNLGLGKIFKKDTNTAPTPSVEQNAAKSQDSAILPNAVSTPSSSQPGVARGDLPMLRGKSTREVMAEYERQKQAHDDQIYHRPPIVIPDAEVDLPADVASKMQGVLNVSVASNYLWGTSEVDQIKKAFGYDVAGLQKNCQLRLTGSMQTDKGLYMKAIIAGQSGVLAYEGTPLSLTFVSKAICSKPATGIPNNSQVLMISGANYVVQLRTGATCPLPTSSPAILKIQYQGDGKVACASR